MANEYRLSYTASEIDEKLTNSVLFTEQNLTDEQKLQARKNIGIEDKKGIVKEVEYIYDGNDASDEYTWIFSSSGAKTFAKVADLPEGEINLVGGRINVVCNTASLNYSIDITEDMLESSVDYSGWVIPASVNGLTQILYQHQGTNDWTSIAVAFICTRTGSYPLAFNGWGEELTIAERGIYLMDNRSYGGNKYAASIAFTTTTYEDDEDVVTNPINYDGDEIKTFTRGLCIGDSITEGVFNHSGGEVAIKKYSYPSVLERTTSIEIVNAGVAGLTSKTWYEASVNSNTQWGRWVNNEWVWSENPEVGEADKVSTALDYSGYDFAIIHLGINDIGMMGEATLENTIATFGTNINNIINKLKTANAGIKIFLATIIPCYAVLGNTHYEAINEKIKAIVDSTDDVYLLDLNTYSECVRGTPYVNQHLTAIGYRKMAAEIKSLISYTIKNNLNDFREIQFIGTDYTIE